jgi:hypothetical protein
VGETENIEGSCVDEEGRSELSGVVDVSMFEAMGHSRPMLGGSEYFLGNRDGM